MHERFFGTSYIKYYRRNRCGMSDVAFRAAPPIGGLSCLLTVANSSVISNSIEVLGELLKHVLFISCGNDLVFCPSFTHSPISDKAYGVCS